jgi:hypothetical protein
MMLYACDVTINRLPDDMVSMCVGLLFENVLNYEKKSDPVAMIKYDL